MTYRIKIVRMIDGKRVASWSSESEDRGRPSRYSRQTACSVIEDLWECERRICTGLVAVELVEVT